MLGRASRLARDARTWLRDETDLRSARGAAETAYPEINALFVRIMRKTGVRPPYLWGSLHGAYLAKALGITAVSLIEFGVAGGNGLADLEQVGQALEVSLGVHAAVYGFDTDVAFRHLPMSVTAQISSLAATTRWTSNGLRLVSSAANLFSET